MAYEDSIINDCGKKEKMLSLNDLSKPIAACSKYFQETVEDIIQMRHISGNKEEAYRSLLYAKADVLKRLAVLYEFASGQLESAAAKLADGKSMDEVLADVLESKIFMNKQLKYEEDGVKDVFRVICEDILDDVNSQVVDE